MDLSTKYLGMTLKNPLVLSSSPLTQKIDNCRKLEDSGVAALVLHSLFEEQIREEDEEFEHYLSFGVEKYAESLTFMPEPKEFITGPEEYLEHIRKVKKAVSIPVIASLNGCSLGGWTNYAKKIEKVGADALELNIYFLPTSVKTTSAQVEKMYEDILKRVRKAVKIPIAVKMGPFFSSVANMAKKLEKSGADGLVLFNRFYQPDIDLDELEVRPNLLFSTSHEMRLPLRWIAILGDQLKVSLAASGGIHQAPDVIKAVMVGADAAMVCATLLERGIPHAQKMLTEMQAWMEQHEYESVKQMHGILSQKTCSEPQAFERANYMKELGSYRGDI